MLEGEVSAEGDETVVFVLSEWMNLCELQNEYFVEDKGLLEGKLHNPERDHMNNLVYAP